MADEPKPSWWKSLPGTLTAATGFVTALSGLVAGLNQLGVFRPSPPAAVVIQAPPPAGTTVPDSAAMATGKAPVTASGGATSTTAPAPGAAVAPKPATVRSPSPGAARPTPPAATPTRPADTQPSSDSAAALQPRLTKGTTLELTVPERTCAPAGGQERFTGQLVGAVQAGGATLPAHSTAFLRLRRDGPSGPEVRLDSVVAPGVAGSISSATVRIVTGAGAGGCLRAGARLAARLGAPVSLERR